MQSPHGAIASNTLHSWLKGDIQMNVQDFLTYAIEAIACGFIALMLLDLGDHISNEILDIFCPVPTSPLTTTKETSVPAPQLDLVQQLEAFETPVVEDPWLTAEVNSTDCCCNYCATPAIQKPLLLLPPAQDTVSNNAYESWSIRQLKREAQERKIKAYISLTKAQLIQRLTT